ncbi:heme lyase CcmF/NrfE family subunit [Sandaracinobacteroides saxicola]|uniref:Heme lyase CcmF/NrfE family subunit n=1 Tax=Sandaracinobacteroides saxicola TaxID=2759707 RepID=A0A7G5IEZ5_9SPHN|nr:heme lyase CcmF/NrfE family subunit [Sandaracinobacteroides saxicola]QMW21937.1 heme lyase CcmF/NrfE family subunit [Sandaracinobacteroides saxicola]
MGAEAGLFALILALIVSVVQSVAPMVGASRADPALMALGRMAAVTQFALVALAFGLLVMLFVRLDLSVALVANHAHSTQPLIYRIAGTWGNHEGSMLLWVLILALFGAAVARGSKGMRDTLQARVLGIQGMIGLAFLAFLIFTSNPFERLDVAPPDGGELNPLLQDPGLALHPPMLYIGYVGFSVAFAFAVAALLEGRVDAAWARWVRPWILVSWVSLTAGITLGSFWAYYELGWGGWWFWDPVENASLLPWLIGTALLHSALVLERRGALIAWTILLAILTFSMSLIGTFLVRSGVLTSVHAFAVDPERGVFILAMIIGSTGAALALFAWRAPGMKSGALFGGVSREAGLTLNNLFLMAATAVVFLGTFYPVIIDAVNGDKISVGPPFYNLTFAPLMVPLLFLVSVGPMLQWKRDSLRGVMARLRWPLLLAGGLLGGGAIVLGMSHGWRGLGAALGFALALWLVAGAAAVLLRRWKLGEGDGWVRRVRTTPAATWGMVLGHAGLGVMTAGITAMSLFVESHVLTMVPGQSILLDGRTVTLRSVEQVKGPNYEAQRATFWVQEGDTIRQKISERRVYPVSGNQTTEAGIIARFSGNDYVAIGEGVGGTLVVRLWHHPLVGWIWSGALILALGGAFSLADRRLRVGAGERRPVPLALGLSKGGPSLLPAE